MKHSANTILLLLAAACLAAACHTSRLASSTTAHQATRDTVTSLQLRYDSIFVLHERQQDYRRAAVSDTAHGRAIPDTVYLHDTRVEYRLRLVRDTLRQVHRDTLVQVVTLPPENRRVPWYDRAARTIAVAFFIALVLAATFPRPGKQ